MRNILAIIVLLCASSASAQEMLDEAEAKLYNSSVGGLKTVDEFEKFCNPLNLFNKLKAHPHVFEKAGFWCDTTREAAKNFAFDIAIEELQKDPTYGFGCDESGNVEASERLAVERRSKPEYKSMHIFTFWKDVYKYVYMCTSTIAKHPAEGVVTPGEPTKIAR